MTLQQAQGPTRGPHEDAARIEAEFDFKRRALGVDDALKNVPGVTMSMLAAFGESGIKTIDDLAGCATDNLVGWTEVEASALVRHAGILDGLGVSRGDCDAMIMHARVRAGLIEAP
jgi:N utilization substance protein A